MQCRSMICNVDQCNAMYSTCKSQMIKHIMNRNVMEIWCHAPLNILIDTHCRSMTHLCASRWTDIISGEDSESLDVLMCSKQCFFLPHECFM